MENPQPAVGSVTVGGRKEPSIDPVKAQGIFEGTVAIAEGFLRECPGWGGGVYSDGARAEVTRKNKVTAKLWQQRWGFYTKKREIQEEEAQKLGLSIEEYGAAVESVNCKPEPRRYLVVVDPSPAPLPPTSSGMVGRRVSCTLERYGPLVMTARNYPIRPPLPPGQVYDPYKQTMVFLGSVTGDPISYRLPPTRSEFPDEIWTKPRQLAATQLCRENLQCAMNR